MTSEPATGLAIGARIGARFEVMAEHEGGAPSRAFSGVDRRSGREVILVEVSGAHAAALERIVGLEHRHLARVLALEPLAGRHVLIAERPTGLTLEQRLAVVPKKAPVDAVRLALRLSDALNAVHERGGVHGLISTVALVVAPDDGPRPALGFAPGAASALRAPGGSVDEPTRADDTWAAAALLHWMITGHAPPERGFSDQNAVRAAGVGDDELGRALYEALASDGAKRNRELKPLRRELARWFVKHAGAEDSPGESVRPPSNPPPLPPRSAAPSSKPRPRSAIVTALTALCAVSLGVLAAWALSALRARSQTAQATVSAAPPASSAPKAVSLPEVPVIGESDRLHGDKLLACVAGYMPPQTFARPADVSFVCSESSPKEGAKKLRVAIVASTPRTGPSRAMKIFARIGWYDMAAFAVLRAGCCPDAPPLVLEGLSKKCPRTEEILREIGDRVVSNRPLGDTLKRYAASIHCHLNMDRSAALGRSERPVGGEDAAFMELVQKLQGP